MNKVPRTQTCASECQLTGVRLGLGTLTQAKSLVTEKTMFCIFLPRLSKSLQLYVLHVIVVTRVMAPMLSSTNHIIVAATQHQFPHPRH